MDAISACLPCIGKWRREKKEDGERQRLLASSTTILSVSYTHHPHMHHTQLGETSQVSPTSSMGSPITTYHMGGWHTSGLSEVKRERIGSISRAYQGRMLPLDRNSRSTSAASSAAPTPLPTQADFHHQPHRGAAPNLGRSTSEPRSLTLLAAAKDPYNGFAPHQIPVSAPTVALRGGRPRSATTHSRIPIEPSHLRTSSDDDMIKRLMHELGTDTRGRSPGPSALGRSASVGEIGGSAQERARVIPEGEEETVVHRELGLKDLMGGIGYRRGGAQRGGRQPSKGRRTTS